MSDSRPSEEIDLAALAKRLVLEGMPVQKVIASEAGVSQPTVSRAIRGQIKQPSRAARRLWKYAAARMAVLLEREDGDEGRSMPEDVGLKNQKPRGDRAEKRQAAKAKLRRRSPPLLRRRSETDDTSYSGQNRRQLEEAAIAGLRDYLNDEFDPLLVIEQLAVLRRAQDPARRRRGGSAEQEQG